jgi:hypothetical protein
MIMAFEPILSILIIQRCFVIVVWLFSKIESLRCCAWSKNVPGSSGNSTHQLIPTDNPSIMYGLGLSKDHDMVNGQFTLQCHFCP